MDPQTTSQTDLEKRISERFAQLPKPVQEAITSADVQKSLRTLSDSHKLHLDQWQIFENEVFLALLGFQRVEDLEQNIKAHVGIASDAARQLAIDVNAVVFEPIREELERGLEHPAAQVEKVSDIDAARTQILGEALAADAMPTSQAPAARTVQPATPPPPSPDVKITRPSESTEYKPGQASHERKSVVDDPYRESVQ